MGVFAQNRIKKIKTYFPLRVFKKMWGIVKNDISKPAQTFQKNSFKTNHEMKYRDSEDSSLVHEKHTDTEDLKRNYYLDNIT
jgi:hypothetical protein